MSSGSNSPHLTRDVTVALGIGLAIAATVGITTFLIGSVGELEARQVVEAMIPTSRLLCSTTMAVTATVLALMLTILSLSTNVDDEVEHSLLERVKTLGLYDAIVFCAATVLFLMHCVPLQESTEGPEWWFSAIYYALLTGAAFISGGVAAIIILLYLALRDLIGLMRESS